MRSILALVAVLCCLGPPAGCAGRRPREPQAAVGEVPAPTPPQVPSPPPEDLFSLEVKPLLAHRCAPCHVPGGKMYERLPFDDSVTVRENTAGILRRLKAPEERVIVERWLAARGGPSTR